MELTRTIIDPSLNNDPAVQAGFACNPVEYNGKIWTAHTEASKVYLHSYDGETVTTILANYVSTKSAGGPSLAVYNGLLYIGFVEQHASTTANQARVRAYNGTAWTSINSQNYDATAAVNLSTGVALQVYNGKLYMLWSEANPAPSPFLEKVRLRAYDGSNWSTFADLKYNPTATIITALAMTVHNNLLFMAWQEFIPSGTDTAYLKSYNGTTFDTSFGAIGGGVNELRSPQLASYNGVLYIGLEPAVTTSVKIWTYNGSTLALLASVGLGAQVIAPNLATDGEYLYLSFRDNISGVANHYLGYFDASGYVETLPVGINIDSARASASRMAMYVSTDFKLYMLWRETNGTANQLVMAYSDLAGRLYLYEDGSDLKVYDGSSWSVVGTIPVTEALFLSDGMSTIVAASAIHSLITDSPVMHMYSNVPSPQLNIVGVPVDTLVLPTGDISLDKVFDIDSATLVATESGDGKVRLIVSIDSGATWYTWDGTEWDTILPTASAVIAGGMSKTVLNALTQTEWALLCGSDDTMVDQIRFGYALSLTASTDVAETDSLTLLVDMRGSWDGAILGTDYTYGYPDNNVLRVTLLLNGDYKINY